MRADLLTEGLSMGTVEAMEGLVLVFREAVGDCNNCLLGLKAIVLNLL